MLLEKEAEGPVSDSDEEVDSRELRRTGLEAECLVHWAEATQRVDRGTVSVYTLFPTCAHMTG